MLLLSFIEDSILFWNNNEVELNRHIYRLLTKEYSFLCHQISYPYHVYVGIDDDTNVFAQTCSYIQRPATDNEVQSLLGGKFLVIIFNRLASISTRNYCGVLLEIWHVKTNQIARVCDILELCCQKYMWICSNIKIATKQTDHSILSKLIWWKSF